MAVRNKLKELGDKKVDLSSGLCLNCPSLQQRFHSAPYRRTTTLPSTNYLYSIYLTALYALIKIKYTYTYIYCNTAAQMLDWDNIKHVICKALLNKLSEAPRISRLAQRARS